ncbi:MAG: phosphodiester glycosidase family protein [Firmicutes bacterium]|nr:phosphodiester glycosidase family protein [Bacillota bacterium]
MKKNTKRWVAAAMSLVLLAFPLPAFAESVVQPLRKRTIDITDDLQLITQTGWHMAAKDLTAEHYFVYQPQGKTLPLVTYGNDIAGAAGALRVFQLEEEAGNHIIAMSNGGFFVLATGVSIGPVIKDGLVRTSGYSEEMIAFDKKGRVQFGDAGLSVGLTIEPADGEAEVEVQIPLTEEEIEEWKKQQSEAADTGVQPEQPPAYRTELQLQPVSYDVIAFEKVHFNKSQGKDQGIVVYNSDFGETTNASSSTFHIVVDVLQGEPSIGSVVRGTVVSAETIGTAAALQPGQFAISMQTDTPYQYTLNQLKQVLPGSMIEISFSASEQFEDTENGLGFERWLVKDGIFAEGLDKTERAPRTAAGILEDGSFLLYTADGRQKGYSCGMTCLELAERMLQLGCVQAVNLDGGASTQLFATLPGDDANTQQNQDSQSSGRRACGNYLAFVNAQLPTGILDQLFVYPYDEYLLSGAGMQLTVKAVDSHYYPLEVPSNLKFKVDSEYGTVDANGLYTSDGEGRIKVSAIAGGLRGFSYVNVIKSPDRVIPYVNGKETATLKAFAGGFYKLSAVAEYLKTPLISDPSCYRWSVEGDIGMITENGYFRASGTDGATGVIRVKAGNTVSEIAVTLQSPRSIPSVDRFLQLMNGLDGLKPEGSEERSAIRSLYAD